MDTSNSRLLAARAQRFYQIVMDQCAIGPDGMIVSALKYDTRRPFRNGDVPSFDEPDAWPEHVHGQWVGQLPAPHAWLYGENTLWATGLFLLSQLIRFRVTADADAANAAEKCFLDISRYFEMSKALEPGVLGKPHGGKTSTWMSYDQTAIPLLPYCWYARNLGTAEQRQMAAENLSLYVQRLIRNGFTIHRFFGDKRIKDPPTPSSMKFLAPVYAAYELTGDKSFRDAACYWMRKIIAAGRFGLMMTRPSHNLWYYA